MITLSFGYHPEGDPQLLPAIQPKRLGMSTITDMKIVRKFPPQGKRLHGKDSQPFVPS
ncbi:hypothetical protein Hanom_Chr10g00958821 [Helianthus anomalus]